MSIFSINSPLNWVGCSSRLNEWTEWTNLFYIFHIIMVTNNFTSWTEKHRIARKAHEPTGVRTTYHWIILYFVRLQCCQYEQISHHPKYNFPSRNKLQNKYTVHIWGIWDIYPNIKITQLRNYSSYLKTNRDLNIDCPAIKFVIHITRTET